MEHEEAPAKRGPILYDLSNAKDDFPWTRYFGDPELGHMDFVPKGWGDILHEGLLEMDDILCEPDVAERICIAQVKEKFETLRFYIEKTWPDLDECDDMLEARVDKAMRELGQVIERMTVETAKVCVFCGTREDVHLRRGWVHYSCSACEGQR